MMMMMMMMMMMRTLTSIRAACNPEQTHQLINVNHLNHILLPNVLPEQTTQMPNKHTDQTSCCSATASANHHTVVTKPNHTDIQISDVSDKSK
jgi:hypothetical protein